MISNPTFQSIILKLQQFWADQGCLIWQPYHTEVGAGTFNPATFLRVLGPEPWWVAYVEPSIRPADGRFGENPNRWQHFYQFQVILKPDPGDPQELYLRSLFALGIDPKEHDIRFVEDNWESPALGAWGLGWEVWLDGQEITQFTYFQQAGGQVLDPVSVEITYGIERMVLALQGVENFLNIRWNEQLTYGDMALQAEKEHCRYNFQLADVERIRTIYDEYEAEARACLQAGLVLPALDYVLKCSHTFNILDARGAVGVAERAALFGRMRELARGVAENYLAQREAEQFPLMGTQPPYTPKLELPEVTLGESPESAGPFLLEVGVEELPPGDVETALEQLEASFAELLAANRLAYEGLQVMGTPRRLVVSIEELAAKQTGQVVQVKGPPAANAYDADGNPTRAAVGFAKSKGVPVEALQIRELEGGSYVVVETQQEGLLTEKVLEAQLPELLAKMHFDKSMRWDQTGTAFSRPIRWILALFGRAIIPFQYAGLQASRMTRGLRFVEPAMQPVQDPTSYWQFIEGQGIVLKVENREAKIWRAVEDLAKEIEGEVVRNEELLREVTHLVEAPTAFRGKFDPKFLSLPRQVLISVMEKHQRYFSVERDGQLLPFFITVGNGGQRHPDKVIDGNEQVIRARFADAVYFVERDLEKPLESYLPHLATLTFQTQLGSMLDKAHRLEKLVSDLAPLFELTKDQRDIALRAAHLSKADLATEMVVEMTSLQGEMGRIYALESGERAEVAQAIFEHYLPRYAEDKIAETRPGVVLAIADRLDSIAGLFAAGMEPTGARDPYGLRRMAIGLVQTLIGHTIHIDLREALAQAFEHLPVSASKTLADTCLTFIAARQQAMLLAEGWKHDVVEAVLAEQAHDPVGVENAVKRLQAWTEKSDWLETLQAYARCARITRDQEQVYAVNPDQLVEKSEKTLFEALITAEHEARSTGSVDDFFAAFTPLIPAITHFFDDVLVMTEESELRANRLGMLQRIVTLAEGVADLSRLENF